MRRRTMLVVVALACLLPQCASNARRQAAAYVPPMPRVPCPPPIPCADGVGHDSPNAIVCINPEITKASPETVRVKSNQPVDFYITGIPADTDLEIQFPEKTPVQNPRRDGSHFRIYAKSVTQSTAPGDKYTVIEHTSGKTFDPTIIIEP